ncbi:hypothetical protein [Anaerocolumna sp. MB42-C2]|uniref:hypothetical protein n=1 Tax=Anaerocolumna sp. MB42-C2 TaxID=3070997 RepID=UPI0027E01B7D|nr:hypothetical protein [Anaerocolumna sp. MB42-C2]WMJ87292.1 hypothetical protein RBU59_25160 [Anaerocolumna sp. MB42-C2]
MQINNSGLLFKQYTKQDLYKSDKKQAGNERDNINDSIKDKIADAFDYSEAEEQQLNAGINAKIQSGEKLSPKELLYLRKKNPILYTKMMMMDRKREILKQRLKTCKSKKEVNDVIAGEVGMIGKKDPDKELKLKTILNTEKEFKKTEHYKRLPAAPKEQDNK